MNLLTNIFRYNIMCLHCGKIFEASNIKSIIPKHSQGESIKSNTICTGSGSPGWLIGTWLPNKKEKNS